MVSLRNRSARPLIGLAAQGQTALDCVRAPAEIGTGEPGQLETHAHPHIETDHHIPNSGEDPNMLCHVSSDYCRSSWSRMSIR